MRNEAPQHGTANDPSNAPTERPQAFTPAPERPQGACGGAIAPEVLDVLMSTMSLADVLKIVVAAEDLAAQRAAADGDVTAADPTAPTERPRAAAATERPGHRAA